MITDTDEGVLVAVFIPADLADWLEAWADHISDNHDPQVRIDAAVIAALYSQKERSKHAVMRPRGER